MEMAKINVTPSIAKEWLDTVNTSNRNISMASVNKYARDMTAGSWRETHQNVIAFYADGTLADGQHRLSAVILSGQPVKMFVATGLNRKDGSTIDQGRTRSVADALKIGGMVKADSYVTYGVAIVKMIRAAETATYLTLTIKETAEMVNQMNNGIQYSCASLTAINGGGLKNAVVRAAVATAYYFVDRAKLDRFCRILVSGMPEGPGDEVVIRLRNSLLTNPRTSGAIDRANKYRTILRVIKAYQNGENLKIIRIPQNNAFTMGIFDDK